MIEVWQAAKKELGNDAYKLFCDDYSEFTGNHNIEDLIEINADIELKPLDQLIEIDIDRYDKEAYRMYEYLPTIESSCENFENNTELLNSIPELTCRKLYANAPFNLEWGKAGVDVQYLTYGRWWDCRFKHLHNATGRIVISHWNSEAIVAINELRHPFPPVK